jgi:hypothetical protein
MRGHSLRTLGGGSHNKSGRAFWQVPENEGVDIVKEPTPSQTEEEIPDSLRAGAVGAPPTFVNFACTDRKKK